VQTILETSRRSTTEYAVLGLLTNGPCSGYELQASARKGVGYVWTATKSQVYSVLPRLVEDRLVTSRLVRQERLPDKQVYRITPLGRRALREWLEEPIDDLASPRSPFLLKVFFGGEMRPSALVAHIEATRQFAERTLAEYRAIERRIAGRPGDYYGYLTLRWGLSRAEAALAWADAMLEELHK
jgi:PadR family transcriptional regulator, regulatory protein AphA